MSPVEAATRPSFGHLLSLTHGPGLFEHACHARPRPEHGYCLDDVARALVVVSREPDPSPDVEALTQRYLDFTLSAIQPDGTCHNRMQVGETWSDHPGLGDWWGRALWGLGVASTHSPDPGLRSAALTGFRRAARASPSPYLRASVFAALGAGEVLAAHPDEACARAVLTAAVRAIGVPAQPAVNQQSANQLWPWPEPRLTYANGSVVEALLLAGTVLSDASVLEHGLRLLDFLLHTQTRDGHFSVTPVGGRGPGEFGPAFDQQPIEVAALADACARAYDITGDDRWRLGVVMAWAWFLGDNDSGTPMVDLGTGGGFDGLHHDSRNQNQGAESTLAAISTTQQARRCGARA
jgi:hypothetical protein